MIKITISEALEGVLEDLQSIEGIQASALISKNGVMMASDISNSSIDGETIGAMVAMLTRSAVHTTKELDKGEIKYLLLVTKYGQIIISKVDPNAILTVLTDTNANIILTINEMKISCKKIRNIIDKI